MKKIIIYIFLLFGFTCFSQTDEHVLLNLGLDSVFKTIGDKDPGGSFFIQQHNQIIYSRAFGLSNLKTKEKFSDNTITNVSSLTKTFIAYSIFILQDQKKLSLDDSILQFFPDLKNNDLQKIKIKHLLSHTSGLADISESDINFLNDKHQPDFEPGSNFRFSEVSYRILAEIIQKVSTISWQQFVKENIFAPAGMIHAKVSFSQNEILSYKRSAKKYKLFKEENKINDKQLDNAFISSAELRKYVYAVNECVFLNCDSLKTTTKPWAPRNWRSTVASPHGYVWFISETKNKNTVLHYEAAENGFRTYIAMYPKQKIIVILVNNNNVTYSEAVTKRLNNLGYIK